MNNINHDHIQQRNQFQKSRSLPIPKEVNLFVLKNYGALFYNSMDSQQKAVILKSIEEQLKKAGYQITAMEIERRLKNMKSHYRRKKSDLELGVITSIEWEYFEILDMILKETEEKKKEKEVIKEEQKKPQETEAEKPVEAEKSVEVVVTPSIKRPADEIDVEPQDLSAKRPKIIEFFDKPDLTNQIPVKVQQSVVDTPNESSKAVIDTSKETKNLESIAKIIESIKAVDQHRLELNRHIVVLETRRCELDVIGFQLNQILFKLTHPED